MVYHRQTISTNQSTTKEKWTKRRSQKSIPKRNKIKPKPDSFYKEKTYKVVSNHKNSVTLVDEQNRKHIRHKSHVKPYYSNRREPIRTIKTNETRTTHKVEYFMLLPDSDFEPAADDSFETIPYAEDLENELDEIPMHTTRSGRTVKQPGHLNNYELLNWFIYLQELVYIIFTGSLFCSAVALLCCGLNPIWGGL